MGRFAAKHGNVSIVPCCRAVLDRIAEFCQAAHMSHAAGKFIALILAIWLPLFSGNALAASIAMQSMAGGCPSAVMQQDEPQPHCTSTIQQPMHHAQLDADQDQAAGHQDQPAGSDCGTCHLACCGYLAAATIEAMADQPSARLFASISSQFQSITPALLDHPPLARI